MEEERQDLKQYDEVKYNFAPNQKEKKSDKKPWPRWAKTLVGWLVAIGMIAAWAIAYAFTIAMYQ